MNTEPTTVVDWRDNRHYGMLVLAITVLAPVSVFAQSHANAIALKGTPTIAGKIDALWE